MISVNGNTKIIVNSNILFIINYDYLKPATDNIFDGTDIEKSCHDNTKIMVTSNLLFIVDYLKLLLTTSSTVLILKSFFTATPGFWHTLYC